MYILFRDNELTWICIGHARDARDQWLLDGQMAVEDWVS
jgi:hypothetical protein